MLVRENDRQITFSFQKNDNYYEIGYKILEQEKLVNILPYVKKSINGRVKLIFRIDGGGLVLLSEVLDKLSSNDIIDLLYELINICERVEDNGFLKRECIWYRYGHIYYNIDTKQPMLAVLPVTCEPECSDGSSWARRLEETVSKISDFLPGQKAEQAKEIIAGFITGNITSGEALERINRLGSGSSDLLADKSKKPPQTALRLFYAGKNGELTFFVEDSDFVIGKDGHKAEGVIPDKFSGAVSRCHCVISKLNGKYFVQDLDSTNHTFVNGEVIPPYEIAQICHNYILSVADIEFRANIMEI